MVCRTWVYVLESDGMGRTDTTREHVMTDASTPKLQRAHHRPRCGLLPVLLAALAACTSATLEPDYARDAVQPVVVQASGAAQVRIRFVSPPESLHYAGGVSYRVKGDELQVVIDRCSIRSDCRTMAKGSLLGDGRTTEVLVPFDGQRLVLLHTDGVQSVVP